MYAESIRLVTSAESRESERTVAESVHDPEPLIASGRAPGLITEKPIGENGFGFDPVMWLPDFEKTFAELPTDVKNANSHRGKAAQQMLALMQSHWFA